MANFIFKGDVSDLDPKLHQLVQLEEERQSRKIILIASESQAPLAVRELLGSAFQNIYAEGYPTEESRNYDQKEIFDYDSRLAEYRRYSDPRYYKGVEYADTAEAIARRRCAELFACDGINPEEIYVNVQPLSGAPANNAVYHALAEPGDTIMGMDLIHGGHLSHGSPVHRSGKYFDIVSYGVDDSTGKIDYEQIEILAKETRPKFIIAGFTSYPWSINWERFRTIADSVGSYLLADIAHVAGLVAGGAYPSPVGIADVITFTTHKSLCGPRGACILTTNRILSRKIDRAVFPGEQGGPHVNVFAAMALAFKLAKTKQFSDLQNMIVKNAAILSIALGKRGFHIPYGGTNTHLVLIDCRSIISDDGVTLSGDQTARILDLAGIVVNRNTIPGDTSALNPSGVRMGTPWVTQRGFNGSDIESLADIISNLLYSAQPYSLNGRRKLVRRSKISFNALEEAKINVRNLIRKVDGDNVVENFGYPHFYFLDDESSVANPVMEIGGDRVREFLEFVLSTDISSIKIGCAMKTSIVVDGKEIEGVIKAVDHYRYFLTVDSSNFSTVAAWLRSLSDGFVKFDSDLSRKIPGPVRIKEVVSEKKLESDEFHKSRKPYYIGITETAGDPKKSFEFVHVEEKARRTPMYHTHRNLGAKLIPFAGWEMPVWYSSVIEEHQAVRNTAGLFDVAHMGVYQVEGPDASIFLDYVVGNDIGGLQVGTSCYTHMLDADSNVIDDLLVYRLQGEKFMLVVNAANDDKDWAWLNAVKNREVKISNNKPWSSLPTKNFMLSNLRDRQMGQLMRVDIALQGPKSRDILLAIDSDPKTQKILRALKRNQLVNVEISNINVIVSRTGYTGEKFAYELFVHPDDVDKLFVSILEIGEKFGAKPIGLGARDSLRTEAGLPLYGHEFAGDKRLGVGDAGFSPYVKIYKPWFIGRKSFIEQEKTRKGVVVRFRFRDKGVRMAHYADPVMDKRGRVIGFVTSCAVDRFGYLTGQAYVEKKSAAVDTPVLIYQGASDKKAIAAAELKIGDRSIIPSEAQIIRRFPRL